MVTNATREPYLLPARGLGTYKMKKSQVCAPVAAALQCGVNLIDTAFVYNNEAELGETLAENNKSVILVTKLWRSKYSNRFADIEIALEEHLSKLKRPIDLWLLHWPGPGRHPATNAPKPADWTPEMRNETWKSMLQLLALGRVRSVGVSNFGIKQIEALYSATGTYPGVNQIELHPLNRQDSLRQFCQSKGIVVQAYGILGSRTVKLLDHEIILEISESIAISPSRVLLAWARSKAVCCLFGSSSKEHIIENWSHCNDILEDEHVSRIDKMEEIYGRQVYGWKGTTDLDQIDVPNSAWGDQW